MNNRGGEEYKEWRRKVIARDGRICMWPGCKKRGKDVHHIVPYSIAPHLRLSVENGIFFARSVITN